MAKPANKPQASKNSAATADALDDDESAALEAAQAAFDASDGVDLIASGFPPYLKPRVGLTLDFTPQYTDARNPKFLRHVVLHEGDDPIVCASGPVDAAEPVEVNKGELYTISDYKGIPFEDLMGLRVQVICNGRMKLPPLPDGTARAPMYTFKLKMSADDSAVFSARKRERMIAEANAVRQAALDARRNAVNALPVSPSTSRAEQTSLHVR